MNEKKAPRLLNPVSLQGLLSLFGRPEARAANTLEISHKDHILRITLKRASAARRFTLRVRGATSDIVLTIPASASLLQAHEFAQRHADWMVKRLAGLPPTVPFLPGATAPLRGVEHLLRHCPSSIERRGPVWLGELDGTPTICATGGEIHFPRRIENFLRQEARRDLEHAVSRHATKTGHKPISLSLRDTSSRWGSCSPKGALNFSWRLILAPPFVLDYLAAHESAHLRHHDHSDKFWALTKTLCPQTEQAEAWLKAHGAQLHRYGRGEVDLAGRSLSGE
jgi:predicted metal-dependent hydrolase